MSGCWLRGLLCLFLVLILAAATVTTVLHLDWLGQMRMSGPLIVGLCFFAVAIAGIYLQLASDLDDAPAIDVIQQFLVYVLQVMAFIVLFVVGIWLVLVAVVWALSPISPEGIVRFAFIVAALFYIGGVIKILFWLSDKGIIGRSVIADRRTKTES